MEYQVPQFIEVEDKVVGPLTLKQFIYLAGGVGLCVIFFVTFSAFIAVIASIPVVAFAAALAFYKINGKSFVEMLEAGFNYYVGGKLFLWKRREHTAAENNSAAAAAAAADKAARPVRSAPKLTRGKLSELAWSVDVKPSGGDPSKLES